MEQYILSIIKKLATVKIGNEFNLWVIEDHIQFNWEKWKMVSFKLSKEKSCLTLKKNFFYKN